MSEYKQIIVLRHDLKMRLGKCVAQGSHASVAVLLNIYRGSNKEFKKDLKNWLDSGMTKVCVRANSEEELLDLFNKAKAANLPAIKITDAGKTEFHGIPTDTCIAIGPSLGSKLDAITKELKLL